MLDFDLAHPFSTFRGDPYYNGKFNGATGWIMQSDVYTKELIEKFKKAILEGENPNDVIDEIFEEMNITEADLTPFDKDRLIKEVEKFYKSTNNSWF